MGDFTRFSHALVSVKEELHLTEFRASWARSSYGAVEVLIGRTPIAQCTRTATAELIVSSVNYMLDLTKQIGNDVDYRDDLLSRAAALLSKPSDGTHVAAVDRSNLAIEIITHLQHLHFPIPKEQPDVPQAP